jgi:hypothetical protein
MHMFLHERAARCILIASSDLGVRKDAATQGLNWRGLVGFGLVLRA